MLSPDDGTGHRLLTLAAAGQQTVTGQALAAEQQLPQKFLEAILADLRRAGLVVGCGGGGVVVVQRHGRRSRGVRGLAPSRRSGVLRTGIGLASILRASTLRRR